MADSETGGLAAKVLTCSDGVIHGTREDRSGVAVAELLTNAGYEILERRVVADGVENVAEALREMATGFNGVIITTGGTGFGPRDLTPEGTRLVIEREAPGIAEATRLVNPLGRLSRGIAGTLGTALIINTPGSPKGTVECTEAVLDVIPHVIRLMSSAPTDH
jgi:molybdenum cofactor synthesis domain-containing protein